MPRVWRASQQTGAIGATPVYSTALHRYSSTWRRKVGDEPEETYRTTSIALVRAEFGDDEFQSSFTEGAALGPDEAFALAVDPVRLDLTSSAVPRGPLRHCLGEQGSPHAYVLHHKDRCQHGGEHGVPLADGPHTGEAGDDVKGVTGNVIDRPAPRVSLTSGDLAAATIPSPKTRSLIPMVRSSSREVPLAPWGFDSRSGPPGATMSATPTAARSQPIRSAMFSGTVPA